MRKAVLVGTDLAYDSRGKLVPLEINTNVGWDDINRKETVNEIFDFTELSMYVREHTIKEICLEGKIAEICKDLLQEAIPDVPVKIISKEELDAEYPDTTLVVRTAWSPVALVDTFAANKEKFRKLIKNEDFSEDFKLPEGNLPNLVVKAIQPQYNRSEYPKFYKADVATIKVPDGYLVEPAVLNVEKLVEGRIPVFRNWSLFVTDGETIDTVYLGTYTKVCGEKFDESKLVYDASGVLVQGRGMLVSLDGLSTQWPADALLETSDEVLMSDGSWKKAESLKIGDKVKSLDFGKVDVRHTGDLEITEDTLSNFSEASVDFLTRTRGYRDFVEITFKDKTTWFDTGKSAYMVKSDKQFRFVNIEDLKKGDVVYFLDTKTSKFETKVVKSIETVRKYVDTYNVSLAENHIFFSRGAGESGAFASIEHNDTSDCIMSPKTTDEAFQTKINLVGTGVTAVASVAVTSAVRTNEFKITSGTGGLAWYQNSSEFSKGGAGFYGCWFPLNVSNGTWTVNVPLKTGSDWMVILRRGSKDGEALGKGRGSEEAWTVVPKTTQASSIGKSLKFTKTDGPCQVYALISKPTEVAYLSDTSTESEFSSDGGNLKTRSITVTGTTTQGKVFGTIDTDVDWIVLTETTQGYSELHENGRISGKVLANDSWFKRTGYVTAYATNGDPSLGKVEFGKYTVSQKGKEPTLSVSPSTVNLTSDNDMATITVTSNAPWKVVNSSSSYWKVASGASGEGNGQIKLMFTGLSDYGNGSVVSLDALKVATNIDDSSALGDDFAGNITKSIAVTYQLIEEQIDNTINVVYNPRSIIFDGLEAAGDRHAQVEYDMTASTTEPVASVISLNETIGSVTAANCEGTPATSPGIRKIPSGSSLFKTGSSAQSFDLGWTITETALTGNTDFDYSSFISEPTKFGDISVSLREPESDGKYTYKVGVVKVNPVPSLGAGILTVENGKNALIKVSDGTVPGLSVSCSSNVISATLAGNINVGISVSQSAIPETIKATLYLKRDSNILSEREIVVPATVEPIDLELIPSTKDLSFSGDAGETQTVTLRDNSSTQVYADTVSCSADWVTVTKDSTTTGRYKVIVNGNPVGGSERSTIITFTKSGYKSCTVSVTQAVMSDSSYLRVWYCPNNANEIEITGSAPVIRCTVDNAGSVGTSAYWSFRYEKGGGESSKFYPTFSFQGEDTAAARSWYLGYTQDTSDGYITKTTGTFALRHSGSKDTVNSPYVVGKLNFKSNIPVEDSPKEVTIYTDAKN